MPPDFARRDLRRDLWRELWLDLRLAVALLTRLPVAPGQAGTGVSVARALRLAPVAGALVGLWAGLLYWASSGLGLGALLAATVAITATLMFTGALHEDGLADLADGLGGGRDRAERLRIMTDSRIGAFGALALVSSVALRCFALAALPPGGPALAALMTAHALARAPFAAAMGWLPAARDSGLGAGAGRPPPGAALTAAICASALALVLAGPGAGLAAIAAAALGAGSVMVLASRRLGGYTGDVLGAMEQVIECLALITLVATL